jgi:3-methylcrotonyl-CoA carboxylase alpha subunit
MKLALYSRGESFEVDMVEKEGEYLLSVNGQPCRVQLLSFRESTLALVVNGRPLRVHVVTDGKRTLAALLGETYEFTEAEGRGERALTRESGGVSPEVRSPMPGKILEVCVAEGERVEMGQPLILLEAMKMENVIESDGEASVKKIHVQSGEIVDLGQLLVELASVPAQEAARAAGNTREKKEEGL